MATEKQDVEYGQQVNCEGHCPRCGSDDIAWDPLEWENLSWPNNGSDEGGVTLTGTCCNCDLDLCECYVLKYEYTEVTDQDV